MFEFKLKEFDLFQKMKRAFSFTLSPRPRTFPVARFPRASPFPASWPSALSTSVAWGPSVIPDLGEDSDSPRVREEHAARAAPTRRGPHAKAQPRTIKAMPRDPWNPKPKAAAAVFAKP